MTTSQTERPEQRSAPEPHPGPGWLDDFLSLTQKTSALRLNSALVAVIVSTSLICSLLLALLLDPVMGSDSRVRLFRLVTIIATVVPLIVGVPAVLFADALMRRINGMHRELGEALTQATLASRSKSEFLANISHEIRTPMNGVLGMVQVLDATELTESQREHLRLIRVSGDMLLSLIDDVLDLSRIESGRVDLHPAPHALIRSLADTVALFEARAREHGTTLAFVAAPGTPEHMVHDSVRVRQCLANLVSNAVKFTQGGKVTVTLSAQPSDAGDWTIVLSVEDTGIGIDTVGQSRLFEAFVQAETTTLRDYGGSGLGLAISRRLARIMGGDITVSSTPGAGACFVFSFKAQAVTSGSEAAADAAPPQSAAETHLQGVSILVVDDSAVNRRVACGLLTPLGADCHEASGGAQALEILAAGQRIDLVLLDMQMPGMDGPATLRALRASGKDWAQVPVVALTANAMPGERERCLQLGMQGYISKPVRRGVLQQEIMRGLSRV